MKKIIKNVLLFSFVAAVAVSCAKKDDDAATPAAASKTDMLSGTWTYVSIMAKDSTGKEVDILTVTSEGKCIADDTYEFTKAGAITYDPKSLKCDDETGGSGTWKWMSNETEIFIDDGDSGLTWASVEITSSSLKYSQDFDGTSAKVTMKK